MTRLVILWSRVRGLFSRERADAEFADEIESHLQLLTEEYIRRGLSPNEAHRAARLAFGGSMQFIEDHREQRGLPLVDTTVQDLRYALRTLKKNPVYAAVAIATLAIGIGAGTTMFTLARAVLLRPLPYAAPERLVRIFETNPLKNWTRNIAAPANYADWRTQNTVFTDIAAYEQFSENGSGAGDVFLTGVGEPQPLKAMGVTGNLFAVLGTPPLMGRTLTDDETFEGKARVVVISYGTWQTVFGGDAAIIGRQVSLSGRTCEVVGVMPRDFFFPGRDVQIWVPVAYQPSIFVQARRPHWLGVIARRKPGVSLERAQQEMNAIARALEQQYPDTNTQMGVRLENLHDSFAFAPRPALLMLSGAVVLLFLIICVNVANLQLGRAAMRTRELAVRRALGAGRARLVRQLLTESLVISVAGGAIGFGIAVGARAALLDLSASAIPLFAELRIDRSVIAFGALLTLFAPLIFGIVPAIRSSASDRLTDRSETGSRESRALRALLIAAEVALSVVLVAGAVLLTRSMLRLQAVDPGFNADHAVAFTISVPTARYPDRNARRQVFEEIERQLRQQSGVQAAGAASTLALRGYTWTGDATVEGRASNDYERELRHKSATSGYFSAMGIRLLAGRIFDDRDSLDKPPVAVVNLALARKYFGTSDVVGRRISYGRPQDKNPWVTIIGVVADEQQDALDKTPQPQVYSPLAQQVQNPLTFVIRSSMDDAGAIAIARRVVHGVDRDLALISTTSLDAVVDESLGNHRLQMGVLGSFALLALFLAALGLYGVLAYFVTQRSRELGIRLALGAKPHALFGLVVREGMQPVVAGGIVGLIAAVTLARLAESLLFGVSALDPVSYLATIGLLMVIALTACAVPAARATRVDPLVALRDE